MLEDEKKLRKRSLAKSTMEDNPAVVSDYSKDTTSESFKQSGGKSSSFDKGSSAKGAANAIASGGSGADVASGALMASGNPYAIGAGLAVATLSARRKRLDGEAKAQYMAEQNRKQRVMNMLSNMSQQASNLGLG